MIIPANLVGIFAVEARESLVDRSLPDCSGKIYFIVEARESLVDRSINTEAKGSRAGNVEARESLVDRSWSRFTGDERVWVEARESLVDRSHCGQ